MQYVQVSRGSLTESIGEVGYVEAQPSAALIWNSGGTVADYDLKVGDQVNKDDVLMELGTQLMAKRIACRRNLICCRRACDLKTWSARIPNFKQRCRAVTDCGMDLER